MNTVYEVSEQLKGCVKYLLGKPAIVSAPGSAMYQSLGSVIGRVLYSKRVSEDTKDTIVKLLKQLNGVNVEEAFTELNCTLDGTFKFKSDTDGSKMFMLGTDKGYVRAFNILTDTLDIEPNPTYVKNCLREGIDISRWM